jgi:hypothetical protein
LVNVLSAKSLRIGHVLHEPSGDDTLEDILDRAGQKLNFPLEKEVVPL